MNDLPHIHTDIVSGDWVDEMLPRAFRPYARLMRLDRPIGAWLLLLPCWWGLALAGGGWRDLWHAVLFGVGAVVMRGAGCVVNDIYDRKFDRMVERTKFRPLANGDVKLWQAIAFLLVLLCAGFIILLAFNEFTFWIGIASLLFVFTYPLAKRYTWWPQLVLGFAFNWGALMGWSAATGGLDFPAFTLYCAGIFWTLGYDTIYAHQDKKDDAEIGVKSLALKLGDKSRIWVAGFYAASFALLALSSFLRGLGNGYYVVLCAAVAYAFWNVIFWRMDNPPDCLRRFKSNRDFGIAVLVAIIMGKMI